MGHPGVCGPGKNVIMFNFLNSAVLIAAAAALIPLLIHLFSRRKVKVVEFSSLRHLKEMQKRQVRRIKLRQIMLLILRMLIILAAVLAFARPATRGGGVGAHAGVSAVVLLDRSASMQKQVRDGSVFDLARGRVEEIIKSFGPSDEICLLPYDRQVYFPAGERFFSAEAARNILGELEPGYDIGRPDEAVKKGLEMLGRAQNLNKELYLVTDKQVGEAAIMPDSIPAGVSIYFVELPAEGEGNAGVVGVDLGGQLIETGAEYAVRAEVINYDNRLKEELLASLFIDDVRIMQTEFRLGPSEKQTLVFHHTVNRPGFHTGRVQISDDDFPPDNNYYFSYRLPEQINVLIIDSDGGGEIAALALNPTPEAIPYWSVKKAAADKLNVVNFNDYDVVILSGIPALGNAETGRLVRFIDDGGGLFLIWGPNSDRDYFNTAFSNILGLRVTESLPVNFSGAGYFSLERFDFSHPILQPFAEFYKENLPTMRFFALPRIEKSGDYRELIFFSNGVPAVTGSSFGLGRAIFMSVPLLPRYTDLASHSFFVPFIIRTVEYLGNDLSVYEIRNFVGENVVRSLPGKSSNYEVLDMAAPGGRIYQIGGVEKEGRMMYDCRPVETIGHYQLRGGERLVDLFPVNLPPSEGIQNYRDNAGLAEVLGLEAYKDIPYGGEAARLVSEARYGRELWQIFLWAAAVLLAVEMIFSREKGETADES